MLDWNDRPTAFNTVQGDIVGTAQGGMQVPECIHRALA